jgi:alcohol dehydrogenase class IV
LPVAVDYARRIEAGEKALLNDATHVEARGQMLNAAMMGAVAFQKDLGLTHSCAHSLSTVCDLHHGMANGVMIPYCMKFNADAVGERFAVMAQTVGAKDFVAWLTEFKARVGVPKHLSELGVKREHLDKLVENAVADGCHQYGPKAVATDDFRRIFLEALGS